MTKTIVILQSNYIPWKGYFDLLAVADEFILYDEVQFTKNDWRNRNRIILNGQPHWLTIAVKTSGKSGQPIDSIEVSKPDWARVHLESLQQAYRKAPYFAEMMPVLEQAYRSAGKLTRLTEINALFLQTLAALVKIDSPILRSNIVPRTCLDPTDRLLEICRARRASTYVSGPAAKSYLDESRFAAAGIALRYANYSGYQDYEQGTAVFEHGVSLIDVLMRCGPNARSHLKSPRSRDAFLDMP